MDTTLLGKKKKKKRMQKLNIMTLRQKLKIFYVMHFLYPVCASGIFLLKWNIFENISI